VDVVVARELFVALVLFGVTGAASMAIYQLALRSANAGMLPTSVTARVRWWRAHSVAALVVSACLLLAGFLGLILL
jgi:uncharacterized iron-regulated membrane protein